jgi:hypothetical protein
MINAVAQVRATARPPLANDRLEQRADGRYVLRLKSRWRDGTTHLLFEPIELMARLAAQVPKPRANVVLYAGVLFCIGTALAQTFGLRALG